MSTNSTRSRRSRHSRALGVEPDAPRRELEIARRAVAELSVPTGVAAPRVEPPHRALARTRAGRNAITAALVAFAGLFVLVKTHRGAAFDVALTMRVQRTRLPLLARLMRLVSWPGFPPQSRLIPPVIASTLWLVGLRLEALFQLVAWSAALLSTAVKSVTRRPRPEQDPRVRVVVAPLGGSSFPSGHVLTYVGVYGFLATVAEAHVRPAAARRLLVAALLGLVGLVGPSRIHQGHHWPTDVLASYLVGLPFLAGVVELYREAKLRGLLARARTRRTEAGRARA